MVFYLHHTSGIYGYDTNRVLQIRRKCKTIVMGGYGKHNYICSYKIHLAVGEKNV